MEESRRQSRDAARPAASALLPAAATCPAAPRSCSREAAPAGPIAAADVQKHEDADNVPSSRAQNTSAPPMAAREKLSPWPRDPAQEIATRRLPLPQPTPPGL